MTVPLDRWPSALQAAVKKHGGSGITDGKFDINGGFGFKALSYLTGLEASCDMNSSTWCKPPHRVSFEPRI